jgi:hypothetical protein
VTRVKILVGSDYTAKTLLRSKLTKEGDRAVDQIEFHIPKNETILVNEKVYYQQDFTELDNLSLLLNFQNSVNDESGNFNNGTASNVTYEDESEYYGVQSVFNGSSSYVSVPDNNNLDLSGEFDIYVWVKWTATGNGHIFDKRVSSITGYALSVNKSTAGDVSFKMGGTIITSSSAGYNDGNKHLIRVTRNSSNLVTLYVDGVSKGTATINTDPTNSHPLLIGKGAQLGTAQNLFQPTSGLFQANVFDTGQYFPSSTTTFFNGKILRLRIYKGVILPDETSNIIKDNINPRTTLKFGGYVTKIDTSLESQKITAQSFGKVLVETEVRGQSYTDKTPEYILNDLITNNTEFTFNDRGVATGLTIEKFIADGKLYDIIRDFASFTNRVFYTTPNEEFFFEPTSFNEILGKTYIHGTGEVIIDKKGFDDTKLVNQLTLIGEVQKFNTTQAFSGNGNDKTFTISYSATSLVVKVGGTEQTPNEDYELDTLSKAVTFNTAPTSGSNNVTIDYEYEVPMVIKGERAASITKYGVHAKKLVMSWITNRQDGVRFVQSYLNRYSEINERTSVRSASLLNYLQENDVIILKNSQLDIDGGFAIKSISWLYPEFDTQITVGEYLFDFFEDDQEIVRKLHDFEGAMTTRKEIQDYESPEELIALTANVSVTLGDIEIFEQSLNIGDTDTVYEKSRATWGSSKYGSRTTQDVYGSGA